MPLEQWNALVRGESCPLCAELASNAPVTAEGYTVANLDHSRLRLAANQWIAGYCVLICTTHVREPFELRADECAQYFADLMLAASALQRVFAPIKMNYQILGNLVPHLHCHLIPRYHGDLAPGTPIDMHAQQLSLTPQEYANRIARIQQALGELRDAAF
jgi:diadenosine tetraphosphate (Ap4A) HIT family hydrolase